MVPSHFAIQWRDSFLASVEEEFRGEDGQPGARTGLPGVDPLDVAIEIRFIGALGSITPPIEVVDPAHQGAGVVGPSPGAVLFSIDVLERFSAAPRGPGAASRHDHQR